MNRGVRQKTEFVTRRPICSARMQSLEMSFMFDIDVFIDMGFNHDDIVGLFDVRIKRYHGF